MSKTLHIQFEVGTVLDIELIEGELAEQWIDVHNERINDTVTKNNYLCRKGLLFYHGLAKKGNDDIKKNAIIEINKSIDVLEKMTGIEFPHRAFDDMSWEDTNRIHRGFTTGSVSLKTWHMDEVTRDDLLIYKYHEGEANQNRFREYFDWVKTTHISPDGHDFRIGDDWWLCHKPEAIEYFRHLHRINKYVHEYEDVNYSIRAKEQIDIHGIQELESLEVEWDVYDDDGGKPIKPIKLSKSLRKYCDYDPDEFNVYICKSITGKDYFQAFHEYDDPLQWDIENYGDLNGGFTIMPSKLYAKWFSTNIAREWLRKHQVPLDPQILYPPPLGTVKNHEWILNEWPLIKWDTKKRNSWGNFLLNEHGRIIKTEIA